MFRIANQRSNNLMEMEARVLLMTVTGTGPKPERKFETAEAGVATGF